MYIYIIPIEKKFRPTKQPFKYPVHNSDYGVEQDFFKYINTKQEIITSNPEIADWHYLPIFWTRWHLNHNYGKEGLIELQEEINKKIINDSKTFTICQYDDGPIVSIGKSVQFLASRKSEEGIDIPLLSSPHHVPFFIPSKKYLASFAGRISTHELRKKMENNLSKEKNVLILDGNFGSNYFVKKILSSYISLCPRGYGGSSFRFFESMKLGVTPLLLGEPDTRPFKKFINWDKISLYAKNTDNIKSIISSKEPEELLKMGQEAKKIFENKLDYQKWCPYVIKELISLNKKMKSNQPNVSFIIPSFNCEKTIEETVSSILDSNFEEGDEIIIVDDKSTDNTLEIIRDLAKEEHSIKIVEHTSNLGGGAARNTAVKNSKNDLIFCLDSDNILEKNSIQKLKEFLILTKSDIASFGGLKYFILEKITHEWVYKEGQINLTDIFCSHINPPCSGNYLFTKESWVNAGGYPEFAGALDTWGFGFRQLATGSKMVTMPQSYYFHRHGYSSYWIRDSRDGKISSTANKIIEQYYELLDKNIKYFIEKNRNVWFDNLDNIPNVNCNEKGSEVLFFKEKIKRIPYEIKKIVPPSIKNYFKNKSH